MGQWDVVSTAPAAAPVASRYAKPGSYTTQLPPAQEGQFQAWVKKNNIPFDPGPTSDYDMRGFWKAAQGGDQNAKTAISGFDGQPHFPDTYKTPYHKTFSNESIYATADAPKWQGDKLIDKSGKTVADETPANGWAVAKQEPAQGGFANFFHHIVSQLNPLPAISEFIHRPEEIGKAGDALTVLNAIHKRAAELPENKGKPVNQWKTPELTPEERATVEAGMTANLPGAEAPHPMMAPAVQAGGQIQQGDISGAAGTLVGGYAVPAAVGAAALQIPGAVRATARATGNVVKATVQNPVVRDVAGVVSPRAAHALAIADRMIQTGQKIRDAINKPLPEPEPVPAGVNTNQPAAVKTPIGPAPKPPAPAADWQVVSQTRAPVKPPVEPTPAPPPATVQPAAAPVEPPPAAVQPETVPRESAPPVVKESLPTEASQPISRADSLKPETAKTLKVGDQRTMPDGSVQTLQRVPIQEIEGDAGNKIDQGTVKRYQEKGYDLQPELKTNPEGGYTIFEGHHRILSDVRNGADSVVAWTPAKTADNISAPGKTPAAEPAKPAAAGAETTQAKPEAAPTSTEAKAAPVTVDDLAQAKYGKPYAELDGKSQKVVRDSAKGMQPLKGSRVGRNAVPPPPADGSPVVGYAAEPYGPGDAAAEKAAPTLLPGHRPITSTMGHSIGYNPSTKVMEVHFKSGDLYRYEGVSPADYKALINAESVGKYFQDVIKPKYSGVKVPKPK